VERERLKALQEHSATLEQLVAERTAELDQSQRQFQDLFEFAPDALVMTDQDGVIELVNHLKISLKTVETYLEHLEAKLGLAAAPALFRTATLWVESDRLET